MQLRTSLSPLYVLRSLRKRRAKSIPIYSSIKELPIYVWWQVHETSDPTHIIKNDVKKTDAVVEHCFEVWDHIKDEHTERFGIPDAYKDYLRKLADVSIRKLQYAITQDGIDLTWLKIEEHELDEQFKNKKTNEYKTKARIEQILGIERIDPRKTTVVEYYTYIELAQETAKQSSNG